MKVINFSEQNTVINNYLAELRDIDVQKNRAWFRQNLRRIGHAMAYEVSKTLNYSHKTLQTPLAPAKVSTIDDRIVIGTVLRAGLALHEGFLEVFSDADSAFVSAYRKEGPRTTSKSAWNTLLLLTSMVAPSCWLTPCWLLAVRSTSLIRLISPRELLKNSTSVP